MKNLLNLLLFLTCSAKAYSPQCVPCANGQSYAVHLTFDDGPGPQSQKVLQILKDQNIKATFFLVGRQIESNPAQNLAHLNEVYKAGHRLAWHTYSHPDLVSSFANGISESSIQKEIFYGKALIASAVGSEKPRENKIYMRCPEGQCWWRVKEPHLETARQKVISAIREAGYEHLGWDIDTYDWNNGFRSGAPGYVLRQVCNHQGGVILMHDTIPWTVENLNSLIESLRCSGHRILDLPELISEAQKNKRRMLSLEPTVVGFKYCASMNMRDGDQVRPDGQCSY